MKPQSNRRPIKVNKLIRISGALAGIIMANPFTAYASPPAPAPSASPVITWTATGKQSEKNVDVLFVQNAKNVSFSEGKLVLRGVNSVTSASPIVLRAWPAICRPASSFRSGVRERIASLRTIQMPRSRSLAATTYRTLSWNLATPSSPATISPTTRESSKARYRPRGDLVRCSSMSSECLPLPCLTPVPRAVPGVASIKARLRLRKYPATRLHRRAIKRKRC